jgi:tRNA(Ile)-lysidine synthetase-like protein
VAWAPGARLVVALDAAIRCAEGGPLIPAGAGVLVAVSGGRDSTALASALAAANARFRRGWRLVAGHVHHGLRGGAADLDRDHAAETARLRGLEFAEARVDVAGDRRGALRGASLEEAARRRRYEALLALADERGLGIVATAHHADDQAETVLLRILRGTGIRGLAAMPARRALAPGVSLVRPLLPFRRADVDRYLEETGIAAREDESNRSPSILRNRVREEALPLLRDLAPGIDAALVRLARAAAEASAFLEAEAAARLAAMGVPSAVGEGAAGPPESAPASVRLPLAALRACPHALRGLVLARAAERVAGTDLLARHRALLERLLALGTGARADLPGESRARRERDAVVIERRPATRAAP